MTFLSYLVRGSAVTFDTKPEDSSWSSVVSGAWDSQSVCPLSRRITFRRPLHRLNLPQPRSRLSSHLLFMSVSCGVRMLMMQLGVTLWGLEDLMPHSFLSFLSQDVWLFSLSHGAPLVRACTRFQAIYIMHQALLRHQAIAFLNTWTESRCVIVAMTLAGLEVFYVKKCDMRMSPNLKHTLEPIPMLNFPSYKVPPRALVQGIPQWHFSTPDSDCRSFDHSRVVSAPLTAPLTSGLN